MLSARGSSSTTRVPSLKLDRRRARSAAARRPTRSMSPVAGHAKVRVQHAPVVEMKQLMLAAALHARDSRAAQRAQPRRRETPLERRMQHVDASQSSFRPRRRAGGARRSRPRAIRASMLDLLRSRLTALPAPRKLHAWLPRLNPVARSPPAGARRVRSPAVRRTLARRAACSTRSSPSIKIVVGVRTGALTVLGAALESGLDMLNNVIGIALVAVASRAPDEDHPYGHDKFETLGALGIVGFLSISCFELLREGVGRADRQQRATHITSLVDIVIIIGTLVVNVFVVWYERRRGRELGSAFLLADAAHTGSDILVTLMALASLVLARIGWPWLDALLAIARRADHRVERLSDPARFDPGARRPARDRCARAARASCSRVPEHSRRAQRPLALDRVGAALRRGDDRRVGRDAGGRRASTRGCASRPRSSESSVRRR